MAQDSPSEGGIQVTGGSASAGRDFVAGNVYYNKEAKPLKAESVTAYL